MYSNEVMGQVIARRAGWTYIKSRTVSNARQWQTHDYFQQAIPTVLSSSFVKLNEMCNLNRVAAIHLVYMCR